MIVLGIGCKISQNGPKMEWRQYCALDKAKPGESIRLAVSGGHHEVASDSGVRAGWVRGIIQREREFGLSRCLRVLRHRPK